MLERGFPEWLADALNESAQSHSEGYTRSGQPTRETSPRLTGTIRRLLQGVRGAAFRTAVARETQSRARLPADSPHLASTSCVKPQGYWKMRSRTWGASSFKHRPYGSTITPLEEKGKRK